MATAPLAPCVTAVTVSVCPSTSTSFAITVEVAMQWNDSYVENVQCFTNNIPQRDGGTHLAGFRSSLTRVINDYIKKYDMLKGKAFTVTGDDCQPVADRVSAPTVRGNLRSILKNLKAMITNPPNVIQFFKDVAKGLLPIERMEDIAVVSSAAPGKTVADLRDLGASCGVELDDAILEEVR